MAAPVMNRKQRRAAKKIGQTSSNPSSGTSAGLVSAGAAELLGAALEHHRAGRLAEAEGCCRRVLAVHPEHADALYMLGVIAYQLRRYEQPSN